MTRLLLIDDDMDLCELLCDYLGAEGFDVEAIHDGERGAERAIAGDHDAVILDIMLPAMSGLDVLRQLRRDSRIPVLMLTARGDDVDRIVGLEMGADDYLPKPFNPRELLARVRAVLRRSAPAEDAPVTISIGLVDLSPGNRTVRSGGDLVELTSTEFTILELLMRRAGHIVNKQQISEQCLGRPLGRYDRSIDMHVSNIRRKLGSAPSGETLIETVRGVGYLYKLDDDA